MTPFGHAQQSKEQWLDYIVKTHGCTRRQAEDAFNQSSTPREAETLIKIARASAAVKKHGTLPSIDIDNSEFQEEFMRAFRSGTTHVIRIEPECSCDSKLLFDQGCKCEYSEWKKDKLIHP